MTASRSMMMFGICWRGVGTRTPASGHQWPPSLSSLLNSRLLLADSLRRRRQCNGRINIILLFVLLLYSVSYERSGAHAEVHKLLCNSTTTPGSCSLLNAPFVKIFNNDRFRQVCAMYAPDFVLPNINTQWHR